MMASKHYYLFGIPVWTIITATEETDEFEEADATLAAQITVADNTPPAFGFTPWTPNYIDWEDTK